MERYSGRIFDNHFHLNPKSNFLGAANIFKRSGGTTLNLTNLPSHDAITEYYRRLYDDTIRIGDLVHYELGLEMLITIGPYPFDYFFFERYGSDPVNEMMHGLDLAAKYIEDGKAEAIGEIGFPHVPQPESVMERFWEMLDYAMKIAHDVDAPIVMHTYDLSCEDYAKIEKIAKVNGSVSVVKHHARPSDLTCNTGIARSVPASRSAVRKSLLLSRNFMLETDFINDPIDANRFLPPDSVPKRAQMILQEYDDGSEILNNIFNTIPESIYPKLKEKR
ncbi:conserved hypothetical protein [Thermoplasma acidophilum]|uniref:Metal-dependent hydrolase n=1 Tax=Thermoplasma acidophilum (strain ATCC 25905 / DSM 1728 / JCM 9062 / NBRC 15155 / AMRC-C165) TaxID=273075 RepID=Q9HII5_THEAC|nr:TatD family hydrolase [Thermoplasma acidophilum]CAC12475.1 conserved hypothetical protein [Thermoplasma acidophilum]